MRDDISLDLVHWTKGESDEEAFKTLCSIIAELKIFGSSGSIKGLYTCVCFTEAPTSKFHLQLNRYSSFGIKVSKNWLYKLGGRPVIYQSNSEYSFLIEEQRWRHVRYEPVNDSPIDFTWEREWRIKKKILELEEFQFSIVLPDESWRERIYSDYAHLFTLDYELFWFPRFDHEIV